MFSLTGVTWETARNGLFTHCVDLYWQGTSKWISADYNARLAMQFSRLSTNEDIKSCRKTVVVVGQDIYH